MSTTTKSWLIVALVVLLLAIALLVYAHVSGWLDVYALFTTEKTPKIYFVKGPKPAGSDVPYNVLVMGSGFRGAIELDTYRHYVDELADLLNKHTLFKSGVAVYRIDLESDPITMKRCSGTLPGKVQPATAPANLGTIVNPAGENTLDKELRVELCWHPDPPPAAGSKKSLWLDKRGQERLADLYGLVSAVGLDISGLIILANIEQGAGGGLQEGLVDHDRKINVDLAVVGLPLASRDRLVLHELGHMLGLHDEIDYGDVSTRYRKGRNIWRTKDCPDSFWPTGATVPDRWDPSMGLCAEMPWLPILEACQCPPTALPECCDGEWQQVLGCPAAPAPQNCGVAVRCLFAPDNTASDSSCSCKHHLASGLPLGMWEGGFYQDEGYYRSEAACIMDELSMPFCAACYRHLCETLKGFGSTLSPCVFCPYDESLPAVEPPEPTEPVEPTEPIGTGLGGA